MPASYPWLDDPNIKRVMTALGAPEVDVRVVGGCVRDALVGRAGGDIDIATPESPDVVQHRLQAAGLKSIPTGIAHGTITALANGQPFEVTSLRRDTACDGRHATVEFTTDWREDASRRDFTINAMSLSPDGKLFDYFDGAADLEAGRIRFVGAARDRIQEDYLRVLRLFRFYARFGRGPIDADTLKACTELKDGLKSLSAERVHQELVKLLAAPNPVLSIEMMQGCGVLGVIAPEATNTKALAALVMLENSLHLSPDWVRRFAALVDAPLNVGDVAERLRLTNAESDALGFLCASAPAVAPDMAATGFDLLLYRHGKDAILNRCVLAAARANNPVRWQSLFKRAQAWVHKPMPVTGADVLALGIAPGPAIGHALRAAEERWVASGYKASAQELLESAKG